MNEEFEEILLFSDNDELNEMLRAIIIKSGGTILDELKWEICRDAINRYSLEELKVRLSDKNKVDHLIRAEEVQRRTPSAPANKTKSKTQQKLKAKK